MVRGRIVCPYERNEGVDHRAADAAADQLDVADQVVDRGRCRTDWVDRLDLGGVVGVVGEPAVLDQTDRRPVEFGQPVLAGLVAVDGATEVVLDCVGRGIVVPPLADMRRRQPRAEQREVLAGQASEREQASVT